MNKKGRVRGKERRWNHKTDNQLLHGYRLRARPLGAPGKSLMKKNMFKKKQTNSNNITSNMHMKT